MLSLLIAIGLLHIASGFISAKALRPTNATEHLLSAGLIAYLTFYVVPIGVGWATGYMNVAVLAVGLALAIGAAAAVWISKLSADETTQKIRWKPANSWVQFPIWALTLFLLLLVLMAGLAYPARSYDALSYHMSNPISWHMTGRFIFDSFGAIDLAPQRISAESAPNVKAVWPFAVLLFTRSGAGTAAAQFPFLLLLVVAVRAIALRIGASPWAASLAIVATIAVPEILFQATEDYSDLMFLSGLMVITWSLLYLWQERFDWRHPVYIALSFAVLAGAKATFAIPGAALCALYGVVFLYRGIRERRWKCLYNVAALAILVAGGMFLCAGPWLIHSWKKYDNPVFPYEVKVGGKTLFEGTYPSDLNHAMVNQFTKVDDPSLAYWNTLKEVWRIPSLGSWSAGLGMGMFVVGIPSLIIFAAAGSWRREKRGARILFAIVFGLLMLTCPMLAVARFSLFQPVMGFIAFAWLVSAFPLLMRVPVVLLLLNTMAYDLFMTASAIQYRQRPPALTVFNLVSGFPRSAQMNTYPDQYTALDYWREEVSGPDKKLALPPSGVSVWRAYAPWSPGGLLRYRNPRGGRDLDKWFSELKEAKITHLYLRVTDPDFQLVLSHREKFRLLIRRLDSHFDSFNDGLIVDPWPEDALFELTEGKGE